MKILFINTLYSPYIGGGAEIILKSLVEGIASQGHEVCVLSTCAEDDHEEFIDGIRVIRVRIENVYWNYSKDNKSSLQRLRWHLNDIYNFSMAKKVERIINEFQPDIVNTHNVVGFSAAVWPAIRKSNIPIVQVLHDQYAICPNSNMFKDGKRCEKQCNKCKAFRLCHKTLSNNVNCVVGVSDFVLQHHLQNGLFAKSEMKTSILNAKQFKVTAIPKKGIDKRNIRFGYIGALVQAKGIEVLLQTFSGLSAFDNISLTVAGSGSADYVRGLKKYEGERINFIGYISPDKFFENIDVLIVPSLWNDTLPTVVFESLVNGIPVIGSSRGGIPEMISEGNNGFLFNPDSSDELKKIILAIEENPSIIDDMRDFSLESADRFMDVESWIDRYLNIFSDLMLEGK
ncbi:glycosyltransferase family 4 protein [Janthinobacterium sp. SUN026]|uniref:glycosyltransferase family 4 protein n=1 Tax=Janthinobacterium sp. SUN026 TaxID=3002438 RepID=UPI0025B26D0E|nr:glycosyltransferase family 4 protein [Janthinobacterium sp. SUN026]MDN2675098.1 glycosyltransferase family 4 protein [Janthinobacterium sp. SUN026]